MDKFDYPWRLSAQVDLIMAANRKRAEGEAGAENQTKSNGEKAEELVLV